jgi:DNA-binding transcriptional LysR family regulator
VDTGQLDFNRVAMFVQIASAGGVTAAAAQLKRPKSSVSRALSQLESDLGVELVVRTSRRFRLTEAGESFYRAASKGIATMDEARDELRRDRMIPHGVVRIAAPTNMATVLLPPVVTQFVRKYPEVRVEVVVTSSEVEPVRDGFDLVLTTGKLSDSSLKVRSLGTLDTGIYGAAAYLSERGTPRRPNDLAKHDCILRGPSGKKERWRLVGPSGLVVVPVDGHIRVDDLVAAVATCVAGGGLALLPVEMPAVDPRWAALVRVLPEYIVRGETMQLVYPAQRHPPLRVSMLRDAIFAHARQTCPASSRIPSHALTASNRPEPSAHEHHAAVASGAE